MEMATTESTNGSTTQCPPDCLGKCISQCFSCYINFVKQPQSTCTLIKCINAECNAYRPQFYFNAHDGQCQCCNMKKHIRFFRPLVERKYRGFAEYMSTERTGFLHVSNDKYPGKCIGCGEKKYSRSWVRDQLKIGRSLDELALECPFQARHCVNHKIMKRIKKDEKRRLIAK